MLNVVEAVLAVDVFLIADCEWGRRPFEAGLLPRPFPYRSDRFYPTGFL